MRTWMKKLPNKTHFSRKGSPRLSLASFAAGLFVDPDPGPVLANTGLEIISKARFTW